MLQAGVRLEEDLSYPLASLRTEMGPATRFAVLSLVGEQKQGGQEEFKENEKQYNEQEENVNQGEHDG